MPHSFTRAVNLRKLRLSFVAALLALLAARPVPAAVRIALVQTSPEQSSEMVALVEAGLSEAGKVSLVERPQIDKVLQEQKLQAVLGADAIAGRIAMGKLLQADLLVFIQPQEGLQPIFNVIISETHQGLRLVHQAVPRKDPKSDAAGLQKLIDVAVEKQIQQVRQVFAVPPLVSNDLGFEFDYLKGAYAKVFEGALAENKGVLVVELDEARAVAHEIALTGGADVSRPLPLYVLGEYRTASSAGNRTVKITLKLMQGDKQIAGGTKENLTFEQAPVFLQQVAVWFLSKSAVGSQAASEPKIEAAQLAERARLQMSLGSWPEALDLMEASLLVDSHQPELQLAAVEVLTNYTVGENTDNAPKAPLAHRPEGAERAAYYRRGLDHLEAYLRAAKVDRSDLHMATVITQFVASLDSWGYQMVYDRFMGGVSKAAGQMDPATLELLQAKFMNGSIAPMWHDYFSARQAATEMVYRVLEAKARDKIVDDTLWLVPWFDEWGVRMPLPGGVVNYKGIDPVKWLQKRRELKEGFAYLPQVAEFGDLLGPMRRLPLLGIPPNIKGSKRPPVPARNPAPTVTDASGSGIPIHPDTAPPHAAPAPVVSAPVSVGANDDVAFTKLSLRDDGASDDSESPAPAAGWLPAGKGIDFVWNRDGIFVMKDRGVLHWLDDRSPERWGPLVALPVFDGRYVWYTRKWQYDPNISLLVVDPQQETVQAVVTDLPACSELEVAPLGPGRALMVGFFGRTVAATIELQPTGKPQVRIVHEFRNMGQAGALDWRDTELVFKPKRAFTLSESAPNGTVKQAVLVWRENHGNANAYRPVIEEHPLVIDLESGGIRLLEKSTPLASGAGAAVFAHDGICELITMDSGTRQSVLRRIGISQITDRPPGDVRHGVPSLISFRGAVLYADDHSWSIGAGTEGPMQPLRVTPPPADLVSSATRFALSEHYGLLWLAKDGVYQVLPKPH